MKGKRKKNQVRATKKAINERGVTLIALVITVIVLLILAGASINMITGQNGVITQANEAKFRTEMAGVKEIVNVSNTSKLLGRTNVASAIGEKVTLEDAQKWNATLKKEILAWGPYEVEVNEISNAYAKKNFNEIAADGEYVKNIYYITDANLKEKEYIYDKSVDMVYKIKSTRIWKYDVHSIEELDYLQNDGERNKNKINYTPVSQNVEIRKVGNKSYYEPDLNNLGKEVTSLIFYKIENNNITNEEYPVEATKWISEGKPNQITENGNTYVLYDYEKQIWANIRIVSSTVETNWTWIPRYAFYNTGTTTNIAFIDVNGNKLNGEVGEFTTLPIFEGNTRKGIWISKYEIVGKATTDTNTYSYYIPDVTGLEAENTYVELYDDNAENFVGSVQLSKITNISKFAKENNWFDYSNKRWANIKIVKNGIETWWVWIPRYAYNNSGTSTDIIFIDTSNQPINGSNMSTSYTIPEAFKGNTKKGIWVSKYEITAKAQNYAQNVKNVPDLSGVTTGETDNLKIYLEIYDDKGEKFVKEKELSTISNIEQFARENNWYDYSNKRWANIKIVNTQGTLSKTDDVETWWVWIPRYAYNNAGTTTDIILLDENNKTLDGKEIPGSYTIPEAFKGNTKKGIWTSKYELVEK